MKPDIEIISKFDTYIKTALRNELRSFVREVKRNQKKYVNFSELNSMDKTKLISFDDYPSDLFEENITTDMFNAVIHNELLYEALLSIKPRSRDLILLKYWCDMTDVEVANILNMTKSSVNKHKIRTLHKLKELMKELEKNE